MFYKNRHGQAMRVLAAQDAFKLEDEQSFDNN